MSMWRSADKEPDVRACWFCTTDSKPQNLNPSVRAELAQDFKKIETPNLDRYPKLHA